MGLFVLAGLLIIFSSDFDYSIGLLVGILSGLTCAVFTIINARLVARVEPFTITLYEMVSAAVAVALFLPLYRAQWAEGQQLQLQPTGTDWIWIMVLSLLCTVYAYSAAVELFKRISVFLFQLTLNLEPVYGILMALLVFGETEKMTINFYAGTFMIFCAVIVYPFIKGKLQPA